MSPSQNKAKYSLKIKDGKLSIDQRGSAEEMYRIPLFALSDYSKYYDVDESFELKFMGAEPQSGFGLSVWTYDGHGNVGYTSETKFMISPDGKIKYYSGLRGDKDPIYGPWEPCTVFKPGEINKAQFLRKSHDWYVLVNGISVKHSYEEKVEPIINLFSGRFIFEGKCQAQIDNLSFVLLQQKVNIGDQLHADDAK